MPQNHVTNHNHQTPETRNKCSLIINKLSLINPKPKTPTPLSLTSPTHHPNPPPNSPPTHHTMVRSLIPTTMLWAPPPTPLSHPSLQNRVWYLTCPPSDLSNLFSNLIASHPAAEHDLLEAMIRLQGAREAFGNGPKAAFDAMEKMMEGLEFVVAVLPKSHPERKRLQSQTLHATLACGVSLAESLVAHRRSPPPSSASPGDAEAVYLLKRSLSFLAQNFVSKNKTDLKCVAYNALACVAYASGSHALARSYLEKALIKSSHWIEYCSSSCYPHPPSLAKIPARGTAVVTALRYALLMYRDDDYTRALSYVRTAIALMASDTRRQDGPDHLWPWASFSWHAPNPDSTLALAGYNAALTVLVSSSSSQIPLALSCAALSAAFGLWSDPLADHLGSAMDAAGYTEAESVTAIELSRLPRPLPDLVSQLYHLESDLVAQDRDIRRRGYNTESPPLLAHDPDLIGPPILPNSTMGNGTRKTSTRRTQKKNSKGKKAEPERATLSTYIALAHAPPQEMAAQQRAKRARQQQRTAARKVARAKAQHLAAARAALPPSAARADTLAMLEESFMGTHSPEEALLLRNTLRDTLRDPLHAVDTTEYMNHDPMHTATATANPYVAPPPVLIKATSLASTPTADVSSYVHCLPDTYITSIDP